MQWSERSSETTRISLKVGDQYGHWFQRFKGKNTARTRFYFNLLFLSFFVYRFMFFVCLSMFFSFLLLSCSCSPSLLTFLFLIYLLYLTPRNPLISKLPPQWFHSSAKGLLLERRVGKHAEKLHDFMSWWHSSLGWADLFTETQLLNMLR